jgi:hypothetical protein
MANIIINWTPGGGSNVTSQQVQRKITGAANFTTIATVQPNVNTYTDTTALDNTIYIYRVVSICAVGGPSNGNEDCIVVLVCPVGITATPSGNAVSFSLPALGTGAEYGTVVIYAGPNTSSSVAYTQTINASGAQTFTVTGLTYSLSHFYQVTLQAPSCSGTPTVTCGGTFTTGAAPSCPAPTNVTATITD